MGLFKKKKLENRLCALHIDDSQWVRIPVSVLLRRHFGMKVLEASSGEEGLRLASEERPDIIILDVMMPQMDGFDTLARLKEAPHTKNIPVIMCTSRDLAREVSIAVRLGAVGYLTKPIEEDMLVRKVTEILTHMGKWGAISPAHRNPLSIAPDQQSDFVIPQELPVAKAGASESRQCSFCQGSLDYITQYAAWYCRLCRKYPDF